MPTAAAPPLVGRERELEQLARLLDDARAGSGGLVLLAGPPGIGKTRLAEELARLAAAAGVPAAWTRCVDDAGAPPLWPWLRLLEAAGPRPGLPPEVGAALADSPQAAGDAAAARFRLVDAVSRALLATAAEGPRVLLVEDLHWSDSTSLRVLRHLAAELAAAPLLVLGTYRDAPPPAGELAEALDDAGRQRGALTLAPGALDAAAVAACLAAAAGGAVPPPLAREVLERTGGRPLFVRAAAAALSGPELPEDDLWRRVAEAADVRRVTGGALDRLDAGGREAVETAALLGEEVDPDLVAAVCDSAPETVLAALGRAAEAGLLVPAPDGWGYRFAHALVRDAVAGRADAVARARRHRRAATVLEERAGDPDRAAAEASRHWLAAGSDPETRARAVGSTRRAAAAAARRFAYPDAARLLRTALDVASRAGAPPAERAGLLLELATAEYLAGDVQGALAHGEQASGLDPGPGTVAAAALVVAGVQDPQVTAVHDRLCTAALASPDLPDATRARLLAQLATVRDNQDRTGEVAELSARAVELAERSDDDRAILDALRSRALALNSPAESAERVGVGDAAAARAARAGWVTDEVWAHLWRAESAFVLGDLAVVEDAAARVERLAASSGILVARWHDLRFRCTLRTLRGDLPGAFELSREAGELGMRMGDFSAAGMSWAHLNYVARLTGDPGLLPPEVFDVLAAAPPSTILTGSRAIAELTLGLTDEARASYEQMLPALDDPPRSMRWAGVLDQFADLTEAFGEAGTADRVYEQLLPWGAFGGGGGTTSVIFIGAVDRSLGRLAATAGRLDVAERHLRAAVETNVRWGARPFVACSRLELAEVLRHDPARAVEALELARQAAREARRLGMPGPLARAGALAAALEAGARTPDPLSAREREVAGLVAAALSNRQIAERLVLSERTVESHVRNILAKLGFSTRTEIATWAVRDDA